MKITRLLGICMTILTVLLCSCESKTAKTKDEILQEAESFLTETKSPEEMYKIHFGYQEGMGSWLEAETEYFYYEDGDNVDGITCLHGDYTYVGDRLYFQLSKQTELNTGRKTWIYINMKTGEKHYICPDPLCEHDEQSGCLYLSLYQLTFHTDTTALAYTRKNNQYKNYSRESICEINFEQNTIREIYNASKLNSDADTNYDFINLYFVKDNVLYFKDKFTIKEEIDGKIIHNDRSYLVGLNLETKEIDVLIENFDTIHEFYIIGEHIYFYDMGNRRFYCTDMNLENKTELFTYGEDRYAIYGVYYDSNTEEIYALVSNSYLYDAATPVKNPETIKCTLYRIDKNLECTEVPMPSTQVMSFQLTNEYIYYTAYYPIDYMTPPYTRHAIDSEGNKIYRVKRSDTTIPELVFDGHGELFFQNYFAAGDYLYMEHYGLVIRAEGQVFRRMGSHFRVNMKENTLKWINLD